MADVVECEDHEDDLRNQNKLGQLIVELGSCLSTEKRIYTTCISV